MKILVFTDRYARTMIDDRLLILHLKSAKNSVNDCLNLIRMVMVYRLHMNLTDLGWVVRYFASKWNAFTFRVKLVELEPI